MARTSKIILDGADDKIIALLDSGNSQRETARLSGYTHAEVRSLIKVSGWRKTPKPLIQTDSDTQGDLDAVPLLDSMFHRLNADLRLVRDKRPRDFQTIRALESDLLRVLKLREDLRERSERQNIPETENSDANAKLLRVAAILSEQLREHPDVKRRIREALSA